MSGLGPFRALWRPAALSLAQRFIAISSALILVTSATVAVFAVRSQQSHGLSALVSHGRNMAEILAGNGEYALYTQDRASLESMLKVTAIDDAAAYAVIVGGDGRALAWRSKEIGLVPPVRDAGLVPLSEVTGTVHEEVSVGPQRYIEVVAPVTSEGDRMRADGDGVYRLRSSVRLGHVRIGLTTEPLARKTRKFMLAVVGLTLLLIAVGVGLTVFVAERIAAPIERLRSAARAIDGGRFDAEVEATGTVEIAELGHAFNAMLARLRESHFELETRAEELGAANAALIESQERYALTARAANDGLWDWNLETGEVHFAPRWKAMLGLNDDEVGDRIEEWLDRVHPEDRTRVRSEIDDHLRGTTDHFESLYRMRYSVDGIRWMLCRGLAVRDSSDRPVRMAGSQTDVTGQKLAEERLIHDALHDALTGLPNRALFTDRLEHALGKAAQARRRTAHRFAVLFVDLDRFKLINDSLGHLMGDRMLVEVARRVSGCLRPGDTAARFGGDEFAILVEDVDDAERVARRLVERIAAPVPMKGKTLYTTASIGITIAGADARTAEEVLRDADIAMYRAKRRGTKHEVFDSSMHVETMDRMLLETDLRGALERQELIVYYQPILDLNTRRVAAFEALLRWRHPQRGIVAPTEFIPILEETRLIIPVGRWVLEEACRQVREWLCQHREHGDLRVSVNVSNVQFAQPSFGREVQDVLEATGLPARHLALEITESVIMENPETAARVMQELRDLGVRIYLDDFGTGYSSLSYLPRFPIDTLKIDGSFVARMNEHSADMEVARAITAIAHNLKMDVIAEGIESAEQMASLLALPCHLGQGWLYSPAVPAIHAGELLEEAGRALLAAEPNLRIDVPEPMPRAVNAPTP